ncbi:high affinity cGMP-specific 3',5'-cyclic phosphodiesterase 9A isoform X2 [Daphnia magna]|uniref:high affinity cGMP-specific 3',5'-cyclic phosphodiesterase 9A isoform X2 n=1 Tax=Daphnia magna TaxID=35525 RepID=UPI001E1BB3F8|nr:high affinity cGMP-specific 3',5'-cyclic phosphodiesterase 9A isoform X2 [Daphnia magna]
MAHAELDATTIKSSHSTNSLSYSPAILKGGQQLQQQPSQISAESIGNCSVANAPPSNQQQRRKTVYFTVGQRQEVAIFEDYTPSEDIKSLFSSAAEAGPHDILKMYTPEGSLVNISNRLESNRPDTPYRLELVAAHFNKGSLPEQLRAELALLDERVSDLERRMHDLASLYPQDVQAMRDELEQHKQILGLCRAGTTFPHSGMGRPYWNRHKARRKSESEKRLVCEKYLHISTMTLTEEIRRCLRMPTFDNWQWEDEEILLLLQQMYVDLDLLKKFDIDLNVLRKFLCQVYMNYNEVPFHNFQHCFTVSQMMYGIIWCLNLPDKIGDLETLILLTSCICHDLDHPGFNNIYQINARTELALRYNDISPLENHHCSVAFNILEDPTANVFRSFPPEVYKSVREGIIRCILATDMARHNEILNQFNQIAPEFDYNNRAHINLLCMVLIKVSDISNEARPMDVAEPWLDCLLQEFFEQSDREKMEGLPVTPFMDRDKITKPSSQCSFIGFVLLPLFEAIGRLYPELDTLIVNPVREALDYYRKLNEASRRNLEQPASPTPAVNEQKETTASIADSSSIKSSEQQAGQHLFDNEGKTMDHPTIVGATPTTPISRERSFSQEEEIRRFSFGLDADTFTEVEICEKTFSFKISTDIRPLPGWSNNGGGNGTCNGRQPSSTFRRASLAVMSASLAESARILAGGTARSATSSPTQSGPCTYRGAVIQEEEDEITLDIPTVATASIHNGVVLDMHKETLESLDLQHNGQQKGRAEITAPLASVEDVTDSVVAVAPVATASRQPSRDNPLLIRLRQWTDRFGLNPVRSASAEPPENGAADVPKSPKLLGSRKIVSNSLSRLFSRSSSHKAAQQQQSMANSVASPESNYLPMPASSAGSRRRSKTIINATEMSRSLDDVPAAHMITDSTNHPSQKRLD